MPKNREESNRSEMNEKLIKLLSRLVTLLEDSLIVEFAEKDISQQDIRRILGIDMRRITSLLKFVKK